MFKLSKIFIKFPVDLCRELVYKKVIMMTPYLKIKDVRTEKELTQIELARLAGISQSYLSELESNKKSPTLRLICKIADVLNVHPSELIYYL